MLRGTSFTDVGLMPLPLYVFTDSDTERNTRNDWVVQTMRDDGNGRRIDSGFNLETYSRRTRHPLHVNNSHFVLCGTCRAVYARLVNQIIIRFILN